MMRINEKLDNVFLSDDDNDNYSYKKAINNIQNIDNKISKQSSSYILENTEYLQNKIGGITKYLKPYISKMLYEVLKINSDNVKIICNYIIAEQNELNILDEELYQLTQEERNILVRKLKLCEFLIKYCRVPVNGKYNFDLNYNIKSF